MKICIKCGQQIDDDSAFCPYCGTKQEQVSPQPVQGQSGTLPEQPINNQQPQQVQPVYGQPDQMNQSIYGQQSQQVQPVYGQPPQMSQPVYGQPQKAQTGMYGQPPQMDQSIYGQPQQAQTGMYGQPPQVNQSIYGQQPQQVQTGMYGQSPQTNQSIYGQQLQQVQTGMYGQPPQMNQSMNDQQSPQMQEGIKISKPLLIIVPALLILFIILGAVVFTNQRGASSPDSAIKNYYNSLSTGNSKKHISSMMPKQLEKAADKIAQSGELGGEYNSLAQMLDETFVIYKQDGFKIDKVRIRRKEKLGSDEVAEYGKDLTKDLAVKVNVTEVYEVDTTYKFRESKDADWEEEDRKLMIYKVGGRWYAMPNGLF
ncbi:MAG: zinc-ribbon domain-containing protein [Eubacterium sp.]|nr:zinc-ribbon domain-containing protein [Eubacterium sp.]